MVDDPHYSVPQAAPRRRGWRGLVLGLALAFLLGIVLTMLLLPTGGWRPSDMLGLDREGVPPARAPLSTSGNPAAAPGVTPPAPTSAAQVAQRMEVVEQQAGGIDSRVAALEQRLNHLDMQTQAAASFAARSENLLIAFASRRALERGQPLGYLADQLRLRFSETHPNAVQTVIDAAASPVSLDQLLVELEALSDDLDAVPAESGLLARIGAEASRLFSVRSEDSPSPQAERRLDRARAALANGQVERAVAEVRQMPGAARGGGWLAKAQNYAAAQRALEVLEASSVAEPRALAGAVSAIAAPVTAPASAPALAVPAGN